MIAAIVATVAAGGSVWFGDETTLREFPPVRCARARRGEQTVVVISGRNRRRVLHGALNVVTGEVVRVVRERGKGADCAAFLAALASQRAGEPERPEGAPQLLVWDNNPPHWTHAARDAAAAAGITLAWLPFRSPELNPCEDVWRELKRVVAANRAYESVDDLAERAVAWVDAHTPAALLHLAGVDSSKFDWLST